MRSIELTDDELLLLDEKVNIEAQKVIDEIKKIKSFDRMGKSIYAEIVKLAKDEGELKYTYRTLGRCLICDKKTTYPIFKSNRQSLMFYLLKISLETDRKMIVIVRY